MERYREALSKVSGMVQLAGLVRGLYLEDIECGHSTVLAELFTASSGSPALREQMLSRMQPWLKFAEDLVRRFLQGSTLGSLVDARTVAGAVLAMYVGVDVLLHLDGDRSRATAMFDLGDRLAATFAPLLESAR